MLVAVAALGFLVFVFTMGHADASYELRLTLRDAAGLPLAHQPVLVWRYDYPRQELRTDAAGHLTVNAHQSFTTSALFGPSRPDVFPVRLAFRNLSPLYYRFGVENAGPVPYQVFNSEYDYEFGGQWVGDFDAAGRRVRSATEPNDAGKVYTVVPPVSGQTPLWRTNAVIHQLPRKKDDPFRYAMELSLQQNGAEVSGTR